MKQYQHQGQVNYRQFMNDLRGKMNENRYTSIIEAYKRVGKLIGGRVVLEELGKVFDARKHPEVVTSKKTEKEAFT